MPCCAVGTQREAKEKLKQYAAQLRQENLKKHQSSKPRAPAQKELSSREKALQFARNVPRPEVKSSPPAVGAGAGARGSAEGAAAGARRNGYAK